MAREDNRQTLVDERKRLERDVSVRTAELSELSNYLQTVREEEKSRLARDIHDELGGILVGAKMDVSWVADRFKDREPEVAAKLKRALLMLDEGVEMKRRIIEELRPTLLDNLGLASAIDWQVRQVCDRAGLQCTLNLEESDLELPPNVSIAIYRIVQEALTNIVKYAKARHVDVELSQNDERGRARAPGRRHRPAPGRRHQRAVARHQRDAPARACAGRRLPHPRQAARGHHARGEHSARAVTGGALGVRRDARARRARGRPGVAHDTPKKKGRARGPAFHTANALVTARTSSSLR